MSYFHSFRKNHSSSLTSFNMQTLRAGSGPRPEQGAEVTIKSTIIVDDRLVEVCDHFE